MIVYVETSALVKLLIDEDGSSDVDRLWDAADELLTSSLSEVEAVAALAANRRARRISAAKQATARAELTTRLRSAEIVEVSEQVCRAACVHAERHALRAYDAVHLASALVARGPDLIVASYDRDLGKAVRAEGVALAGSA